MISKDSYNENKMAVQRKFKMITAAECTNCHVVPSVEIITNANCICGARTANSPCPVCLFTLLNASIDRHCVLSVKVGSSISKVTLSGLHIYPGCMSFVVQNVL